MSGESKLEKKAGAQDLGSPKPKRKAPKIIMGDTKSAPAFTKAEPIVIDASVERASGTGNQGSTIGDGTTFTPRRSRTRITTTSRPQGQGYTPRSSSR